jgi:membrane-associated phospholipid phosphatase
MITLRHLVEAIGLGFVLTALVVISTYLAALPALPLADEHLARLDRTIGFDWIGFVRAVDAWPWLAQGLGLAYKSIAFQLIGIPLLLAALGQPARAYRFVTSYALVGLSASLVSIWFPAVGAFPFYDVAPEHLDNINIHFGYFFLDQFDAVRNNPQFIFSLNDVAGIVTFPSVHAAVAALCVWGAWSVRYLRYQMLLLNVGMAISAVSHGSHYLVDVPAGIFLAIVCIRLTVRLSSYGRSNYLVQRTASQVERAQTYSLLAGVQSSRPVDDPGGPPGVAAVAR